MTEGDLGLSEVYHLEGTHRGIQVTWRDNKGVWSFELPADTEPGVLVKVPISNREGGLGYYLVKGLTGPLEIKGQKANDGKPKVLVEAVLPKDVQRLKLSPLKEISVEPTLIQPAG